MFLPFDRTYLFVILDYDVIPAYYLGPLSSHQILCFTEPSEIDWLQVYDNDTLMKNCFKDWSQSKDSYISSFSMFI